MTFLDRVRAGVLAPAAFLFCLCAPVAAQTMEFTFDGDDEITARITDRAARGSQIAYRWDGELRLGLLGGEPLVSMRFKFEPSTGQVSLPVLGAPEGSSPFELHRFENLPEDLREKLRLIDVEVRMSFFSRAGMVDLVADVGASGAPGEWYFNVPGSPDWDKLFLVQHSRDMWIDEAVAKDIWASGLTLSSVRVDWGKLSLYDMQAAYMKDYGRERYRAMGRAYERLAEGVKRSYGVDVSNDRRAWSQAYLDVSDDGQIGDPERWEKLSGELEGLLDKMFSLPENLRLGNNHGPYEQAVRDARKILESVDFEIASYEPRGIDPDTLEKGHAAEFDDDSVGGPKFVLCHFCASRGHYIYSVNADGIETRTFETKGFDYVLANDLVVATSTVFCGIGQTIRDRAVMRPDGTPVDLSVVECPSRDHEWRLSRNNYESFAYEPDTGEVMESYGGDYRFQTAESFEIRLSRDIKGSSRDEDIAIYHFDKNFRFLRKEAP